MAWSTYGTYRQVREDQMNYRGPGFFAFVWFSSSLPPSPSPSPVRKLSLFLCLPVCSRQCRGSVSATNWKVGSGSGSASKEIWIRIPTILQIRSLNEPIWAFFKVLSLYLEARIRIRIKVKGRIRVDPSPHQSNADPQHWSLLMGEWGVWGRSQIIRRRESLVFYNSFNIPCGRCTVPLYTRMYINYNWQYLL